MKNLLMTIAVAYLLLTTVGCCKVTDENQRSYETLKTEWKFTKSDPKGAEDTSFDDSGWSDIRVPHDWAIDGVFDEDNDMQMTKVIEDGEKVAKKRTGRTGGLPYEGVGWYRRAFNVDESFDGKMFIEFDGAFSYAKVYINGEFAGEWPYGYTSFSFDISKLVKPGSNLVAVRLENKWQMSRWYPGAGIYREVRLLQTANNYVKQWGTYITTPDIKSGVGTVDIETEVASCECKDSYQLLTEIYDNSGKLVASKMDEADSSDVAQTLVVENPVLWNLENPTLYRVESKVIVDNKIVDIYSSSFGFRYIEYPPADGFHLNGKRVQINGVCMHSDLGPLGSAINVAALRRQLVILKEMGTNAIRTSHNPPSPKLLELCDEMGFLVDDEAFDEWTVAKVDNGYHNIYDEWSERDLVALVKRDRNHPSVIMWSMGNEIREQNSENGYKVAKRLVDICRRVDPTRPTTIGMNSTKIFKNGFAAQFDVKGWNYHTGVYPFLDKNYKDWSILASETASTTSTRGFYRFPVKVEKMSRYEDSQCSSYDRSFPSWASSPDRVFAALDDYPQVMGEFVWTGFDYLGEPTPYNIAWPTKNSYFGIIDLCGFPKDRFYLYQSRWSDKEVLHIMPHWNWPERVGKVTPIQVYSSYDSAELFVNGKSYGICTKSKDAGEYGRYRLFWDDVIYEPGEVKVVAFDQDGKSAATKIIKTVGEPYAIKLSVDRDKLSADGEDLAFVTIEVVDKDGNVSPRANNLVDIKVEGAGYFRATGNGNSTDITPFRSNRRELFNGKCLAIVGSTEVAGNLVVTVKSKGFESKSLTIETK